MLSERQALDLLNRIPLLRRLGPSFLRYLAVGGLGFLVDAALLELFIFFDLSVYAARALSMTLAIGVTYLLHKNFTFTDAAKPAKTSQQAAAFVACQLFAAAINYGVFCLLLGLLPAGFIARMFALCCGVAAGLSVNFMLLRFLVFPQNGRPAYETLMPKNKWRVLLWLLPLGWLVKLSFVRQSEVLKWPNLSAPLGPNDPDVWMRLNQVRQWLIGDDFLGHVVRNTNAPDIGTIEIHWTRPLDALLALGAWFAPRDFSVETRLMLSATWLPPLLGLFALFFMMRAAQKHFNNIHVTGTLFLLMMFSPLTAYYMPGDADHHGLLAMLWCAVICIIMRPLTVLSGLAGGALLGVMLWISTEAVMPIAAVYAILGFFTLRDAGQMKPLAAMAWGTFVVSALGLAAEYPLEEYFTRVQYDTLSIPYVALTSLVAVGASLLCLPKITALAPRARLICAISVAAAAAGVEMLLYPKIISGPMADADPFVKENFLLMISESKSLFLRDPGTTLRHLWQPMLGLGLLVLMPKRREKYLLLSLLAAGFVMVTVQGRWTYYLQPVAVVAIAALFPAIITAALRRVERPFRPYAILFLVSVIVAGIAGAVTPKTDQARAECQSAIRLALQTGIFKSYGNLYVDPAIGGDVLFFTPQKIIAGNYHREGQGLKTLHDIETAKTAEDARNLLDARKITAVLACPAIDNKWISEKPSWLKPVAEFDHRAQLFFVGR